jgi:hypothetical protein
MAEAEWNHIEHYKPLGGGKTMATTVYVVTTGDYSDYRVKALCSTLEKAKDFIQRAGIISDSDIDEWEVDGLEDYCNRPNWECVLNVLGHIDRRSEGSEFVPSSERGGANTYDLGKMSFNKQFFRGVSYESAEHALKLAAECRQAWLRKQTEPEAFFAPLGGSTACADESSKSV